MTDNVRRIDAPTTDVTLAGVRFRSPIGLAPIGGGSHWGKPDPDPERERQVCLDLLLQSIQAGSSCVYLNFSYLSEETFLKLRGEVADSAAPGGTQTRPGGHMAPGERFMRAGAEVAPYGVEGLYSAVSPGPAASNKRASKNSPAGLGAAPPLVATITIWFGPAFSRGVSSTASGASQLSPLWTRCPLTYNT